MKETKKFEKRLENLDKTIKEKEKERDMKIIFENGEEEILSKTEYSSFELLESCKVFIVYRAKNIVYNIYNLDKIRKISFL